MSRLNTRPPDELHAIEALQSIYDRRGAPVKVFGESLSERLGKSEWPETCQKSRVHPAVAWNGSSSLKKPQVTVFQQHSYFLPP
jgi:hypothetical protein